MENLRKSILKEINNQFPEATIQKHEKKNHASIVEKLLDEVIPVIKQKTELGTLLFYCLGEIPIWRACTLLTKEPETIEWINSFRNEDIMWDIGANVGVYSLYAAMKKIKVFAFEPSPPNYSLLCKNIEINNMDKYIHAYCIAFDDKTSINTFYMANTAFGGALNSFSKPVNCCGEYYKPSVRQAMLGFSIDDFIKQFKPIFPNHIKIDVDGNENLIIRGGIETLADKRVKSLLVELDSKREEYLKNTLKLIEQSGMRFSEKTYVPANQEKKPRILNYIFYR